MGDHGSSKRKWTQFVGTVGALANWGIPAAAFANIYQQQDPGKIDPKMTSVLIVYSFLFMRWSLAIDPPNYPLLVMHGCNEIAQFAQLGRHFSWRLGGKKSPQPLTQNTPDQGLKDIVKDQKK